MNELHITPQDADLYVLGTLDTRERERCDEHAATCDACSKVLGDSEAVIEALEVRAGIVAAPRSKQFGRGGSNVWMLTGGLCASLAVAMLLFARVVWLGAAVHGNDVAMVALVHSHFDHAPFAARHANAPQAKVMYARDGSWLFVVVDRPQSALVVKGFDALGNGVDLGRIAASSGPASDFLQPKQRVVRIDLDAVGAGGSVLSSAALVYP